MSPMDVINLLICDLNHSFSAPFVLIAMEKNSVEPEIQNGLRVRDRKDYSLLYIQHLIVKNTCFQQIDMKYVTQILK